jgi:hypothetical protein
MTKPSIIVDQKTVCGRVLNYPSCTISKIFVSLTGNETLTESDLNKIESIGFNIIIRKGF